MRPDDVSHPNPASTFVNFYPYMYTLLKNNHKSTFETNDNENNKKKSMR